MNKIILGDSTELVHDLDESINCIITDPPYGMGFRSNFATNPDTIKMNREIGADDTVENALETFYDAIKPTIPLWTPDFEMYVFTTWSVVDDWIVAVKDIDPSLEYKMMLVWQKDNGPGMGDLDSWGCGYEIILYLKRGRFKPPYRREAVIHCNRVPSGQNIHPTEKPVPLIEKLIEMSTKKDDLIFDPFSGSGSTSVAAMNLGRRSVAFEQDEGWYKASLKRLTQDSLLGMM